MISVYADGGDMAIVGSSMEGDLLLGGYGVKELLRNTITGEVGIRDTGARLVRNTIRLGPLRGSGVTVRGDSEVSLDRNDIMTRGRGIFLDGDGVRGMVTDNVVSESEAGLYLDEGAVATAEGEHVRGQRHRDPVPFSGHIITPKQHRRGQRRRHPRSAGSTEIMGNAVTNNRNMGIGVLDDASPVLVDNELCGNGTDLVVAETANVDQRGNAICPATD